ncbi:MAG: response regulator, partial [Polyangiaceae bacterium]
MKISYKILIAGADPADTRFIREALAGIAGEVVAVSSAEAPQAAASGDADLIVLGEEPDRGSAFVAMKTLREGAAALIPVILLAASDDVRPKAMEAGFADMLVRPLDADEVMTKIETALKLSTHRSALDEKAKMENVLDAMEDGIAILDGGLKVARLNDRARAFLAVPVGGAQADFVYLLGHIFKIRYDGDLKRDLAE